MKKLLVFVTLALSACGGGGGDTPAPSSNVSTTPASAPPPTTVVPKVSVTLQSSKTKVMEGETFTLTWQSSNANSCSATGSWTGTTLTNGNVTYTAGGIGDKTYTITCNNDAGTQTANVVITVTKNICVNPFTDTKYPETFRGSWPVAQPTKTLSPNVVRMIALKDYFENANTTVPASVDPGCPKDWYPKLMVTLELDRLKAINTEKIFIYNYSDWVDSTVPVMSIYKPNQQIPDTYIKFIVEEAAKRNIEVYYSWMFDPRDHSNRVLYDLGTPVTASKLIQMVDSYAAFMKEHVKFLEQVGVKGVTLDWSALAFPNSDEHQALLNQKFAVLADDIRKNFSGKIILNASAMFPTYDQTLFSKVDYYNIGMTPKISEAEANAKNTTAFRNAVKCDINHRYMVLTGQRSISCNDTPVKSARKLPPVIFYLFAQSREKAPVNIWVEDGFCVSGKAPNGTMSDCVQKYETTDFSFQAFATNVAMEEFSSQPWFDTFAIIGGTYWHTDEMLGAPRVNDQGGFPNLSQSIRNKPAEDVVRYWFTK